MAKSNLKSINNNGVTQNSTSQIHSNYSYTHNTFVFLNYLRFFQIFTKSLKFYNFKIKYSVGYKYSDYYYTMETLEHAFIDYSKIVTPHVKFFFLNGRYTYVLDTTFFEEGLIHPVIFKRFKNFFCLHTSKAVFNSFLPKVLTGENGGFKFFC